MAEDLQKVFTVDVDSIKNGNGNSGKSQTVAFSQGDVKTAILVINLTENGLPIDIVNKKVRASFKKTDGKSVMQDETTGISKLDAPNGRIQIILSTQVLSAVGNVRGQISITDEAGGLVAETTEFTFYVRESIINTTIVSSNQLPIIEKTIEAYNTLSGVDLQKIVDNTNTLTNVKTEVETARGTKANLNERFVKVESDLAEKANKSELLKPDNVTITKDELGNITAIGQGGGVQTNWSASTTYAGNDIVTFGGHLYLSRFTNNKGHNPANEPNWWSKYYGDGFDTSYSRNIYNPLYFQKDKIVDYTSGNYDSLVGFAQSGKLAVLPGNTYTFSKPWPDVAGDVQNMGPTACYDAAGTYLGLDRVISSYPVASGIAYSEVFANGRYSITYTLAANSPVRFLDIRCINKNSAFTDEQATNLKNAIQLESGTAFTQFQTYDYVNVNIKQSYSNDNPLYGKILTGNGDSISEGGAEAIPKAWIGRIGEKNNMIWENRSVGGGTVAGGTTFDGTTPRHWISRDINNMRADADYIILEGGRNDWAVGVPLGEISTDYTSSLDDTNFCGALESMFRQAIQRFPGKKIGYIIPYKMLGQHYPYGATTPQLEVFFEKAKEICQKWSIPYIDLYNTSNLTAEISEVYSQYFVDQTHINEKGYDVITPKIEAWMKTL